MIFVVKERGETKMINLFALKANIDLEIEASKKESPNTFRCGMLLAEIVSEALEQQIAADVVEVVRCKDCFYAEETEGIIGGTCLYCTHWCKDVDGDTFCSNGFSTISKRRTENDS
jgi:hypothetical protein